MTTIIAGYGQIGRALYEVLSCYNPSVIDPKLKPKRRRLLSDVDGPRLAGTDEPCNVLHITFPYSPTFEEEVRKYQKEHKPKVTVIHSTVPPGTSRKLGALHSPVIGIHPDLVLSLRTFPKFIGGEQASEVANYFRRAGVRVYLFDKPETTELMKILDTTFYGLCIEYTKDVKRQCEAFGVPFEAWTLWTDAYNDGYRALGHPEYVRPNLVPIMVRQDKHSHCTIPNCSLLETPFTEFVKALNAQSDGVSWIAGWTNSVLKNGWVSYEDTKQKAA